jgi:hypothetical protein
MFDAMAAGPKATTRESIEAMPEIESGKRWKRGRFKCASSNIRASPIPLAPVGETRFAASMLQADPAVPGVYRPREEFHSSAVDLLKPPPDFLTPSVLCVFVNFMIHALPQRIGERGTGRLGQV